MVVYVGHWARHRSPGLRNMWILPFLSLKSARRWVNIKDIKLKVTKIYKYSFKRQHLLWREKEDAMTACDRGKKDSFRLEGAGKSSLRNWYFSWVAIQMYPNTSGLKGGPDAWLYFKPTEKWNQLSARVWSHLSIWVSICASRLTLGSVSIHKFASLSY